MASEVSEERGDTSECVSHAIGLSSGWRCSTQPQSAHLSHGGPCLSHKVPFSTREVLLSVTGALVSILCFASILHLVSLLHYLHQTAWTTKGCLHQFHDLSQPCPPGAPGGHWREAGSRFRALEKELGVVHPPTAPFGGPGLNQSCGMGRNAQTPSQIRAPWPEPRLAPYKPVPSLLPCHSGPFPLTLGEKIPEGRPRFLWPSARPLSRPLAPSRDPCAFQKT